MAASKKRAVGIAELAARVAIDDLTDALAKGDEAAALEAVGRMLPAAEDGGDEWTLASRAVETGWPRVALAMVEAGKAGGMDLDNARAIAAEEDNAKSFAVLAPGADVHDLLRCAYKAMLNVRTSVVRRPGEKLGGVAGMAIDMASKLRMEEWESVLEEGLEARWAARTKRAYERACESWGVPVWSACAATPMELFEKKPASKRVPGLAPLGAEAREHEGHALDLPEEGLLWRAEDARALEAENSKRSADAQWRADLLGPMLESWAAARDYLPRMGQLMGEARGRWDRGGAKAKLSARAVADRIDLAGIGAWGPFMLAWADHSAFGERDIELFGNALDGCVVDVRSAGLMAANIGFGSFNARIAVIAVELRRRGLMDEAAAAVVAARLEDLSADPTAAKMFEDVRFGPELRAARDYLCAQGAKAELSRCAGDAKKSPLGQARL